MHRSRHSPAPSTGSHGQNLFKLAQGLFVVPEKIEAALTIGCPSVRECFVYGDGSRSHLLAVVVPRSSTAVDDDADHQRLKLVITEEMRAVSKKEEMRYYEVPREVILAHEPFSEHNGQRTITGKLNRRALAEHYRADIDAAYARTTAQARLTRDTIRDAIAHTINPGAEQLQQEESQQATLLELGGDSLGAVNLMKIIRERFAVSLPLAMVLERPIDELAEYVERHSGGGGAASGEGEDLPSQGADPSTAATQSIDWRRDSRLGPEIISLLDEKCQASSQVRLCPFLT
jgi:fatty acid CoA ligase FadD9